MGVDEYEEEIVEKVRTPGGELDNRLLEEEYLESEKGKMNTIQFCVNLMKGIAGTGSLAIPYAFSKVGIIPSILLFAMVCAMMVIATYQLLDIHNNMGNRRILGLKSIQTSNVYAEMVFNVLGTGGYRFYVVFSLITLYGSNIGSVIAMAGFLENMTFFGKNETSRKIVIQIFITIICIVLCLLKDPSVLVPISSSGLIAIIASYLILIIYGMSKYKPSFEAKDLWPESASALLENIGIYVYCMGFILFLLTQYKYIRRDCRKTVVRSTGVSISLMALIYIFIGIILSQYYKNSENGVKDNIMQSLPAEFTLGTLLNIAMFITVAGGFPLWMEPINETIEKGEIERGKLFIKTRKYIILRVVEIVCISVIALVVPSFSQVLSLIGNFTDVLTTFIFPAVMHIVFFRNRTKSWIMWMDMITLVISVFIMIICTSISLKNFGK
ncbi:hypothetical protein WA171_005421 [Blastocystis sp. BT1]